MKTVQQFRLILLWLGLALAVNAEDADVELGVRSGISAGNGTPANDVVSAGVQLRWAQSEDWYIGVEFSSDTFDFERPATLLGIQQTHAVATIDAKVHQQNVYFWFERRHGEEEAGQWFYMYGLGWGRPDVSDASGATESGGTFYLTTKAANEAIVWAGAGYRVVWGQSWLAHASLRAEYRNTDYKISDDLSQQTGSVGAWTLLGLDVALTFLF